MQQKWPNRDERSAAYQKPETESQPEKCRVDKTAADSRTWQQKANYRHSAEDTLVSSGSFYVIFVYFAALCRRLVQSGVRSPQAGPTNP